MKPQTFHGQTGQAIKQHGRKGEPAERATAALADKTQRPVFCTVGQDGVVAGAPGQTPVLVPGYPVQGPVDIVGAGDSATSALCVSLLAGASLTEAAAAANLAASITVQQLGCTGTASPQQMLSRWEEVKSEG